MKKNSIKNIINEEISKFIKEENYFNKTIPDDVKRLSKSYKGRGVIWYGDPNQMIRVHKDNIHGMYGNVYDRDKLKFVVDLIRDSEDYVEFECSYAHADYVDLQEIAEHQESYLGDRFYTDYDGHDNPYTTGDEELDVYLGTQHLDEIDSFDTGNPSSVKFFEKYKTSIATNTETEESLRRKFTEEVEDIEDEDTEALEEFIDYETGLDHANKNKSGDIGEFMVQLRDGHHRVMGAIEAGEEWVCVNLAKRDIDLFPQAYQKLKV